MTKMWKFLLFMLVFASGRCVEGGLGQIAKLLVLVRRCARPVLLGQVSTARTCGRESRERESSYGDTKRWVRHEKAESKMERNDTCAKNLFGTLEPCVYVHEKCGCAQENVCATSECMYTPRRTHCSRYHMCTKPSKTVEKFHSMTILTKKTLHSSSGFGPLKKFSDFIIPCPS